MSTPISAGKYRALQTLADDTGRFTMVAVDQRPPIFAAIAKHGNRAQSAVTFDEVAAVKGALVRELAPHATAILIDPNWTHPLHLHAIPGRVGLISTLEDYAFELIDGERRSHPIAGWSVAKIRRSGGMGVKLLVWHRPDLSEATRAHQDALVRSVGHACDQHDLPLILEILCYPLAGEDADGDAYARAKPERVLGSLRHYAQPEFKVDLMKLEFPLDLKRVQGFHAGALDGRERAALWSEAEARGIMREMDALSPVPWVLLSAGVGPREFSMNVEWAVEAGASGVLAGRAVWFDALGAYPDMLEVQRRLQTVSLPYMAQLRAMVSRATPWHAHRSFAGAPVVAGAGERWVQEYSA